MTPCAIYTRKSSEEGLEQGFNSLDAQREACEAFILSQKAQGWKAVDCYDDGGFSGGNVDRPGLRRLLADIALKRVRVVVVYKVDRLTRSLADFAKLVELFDAHGVSFVSVTQQFNTTSSMGRLTLNVLLSFAQFEREVTGERIRDKIAASKRKGMWMGGFAPIGYLPHERTLKVDEPQAARVREIFRLYLELGCVKKLKTRIDALGWKTPVREGQRPGGDRPFTRGHLYRLLSNPIYIGQIAHKGQVYPGQHEAIIEPERWQTVQAQLARHAQTYRERSNAAEPAPLAGLLFDDRGNRFAPTHATKKSRRYRYYVRPAVDGEKALWMPAAEIEGLVVGALQRFLGDKSKLLELMPQGPAQQAQQRLDAAASLTQELAMGSAGLLRTAKGLIARVVVKAGAVELSIKTAALWPDQADPGLHVVEVPAQLKRSGSGMKLVVPGAQDRLRNVPDARLVALLAKARRWFDLLRRGESPSVRALAKEHGTDPAEAISVIYLAFLAPDIVERIAAGSQPAGLGVKRLLSMAPLPLDWEEQRRLLGMV